MPVPGLTTGNVNLTADSKLDAEPGNAESPQLRQRAHRATGCGTSNSRVEYFGTNPGVTFTVHS